MSVTPLNSSLHGGCLRALNKHPESPDHDPSLAPTTAESPYPPPFSSLYFPTQPTDDNDSDKPQDSDSDRDNEAPPAFAPAPPFEEPSSSAVAETKAALPRDTKDGSSSSKDLDDGEPPPPYSEGSSPLDSFTYVMATAGGPASIITQVSQGGGPPINTLGGQSALSLPPSCWSADPFSRWFG